MPIADLQRVRFATDADLSACSFQWAVMQLAERGDSAESLLVHPFAKHLAMHIAYHSGWRVPVEIQPDLDEDEWLLCGAKYAMHSEGA